MTGEMFADLAGLGAFDMQRMYQDETGSHPGGQERFGPMDDVINKKTSHGALHTGIRFSPILLEQSRPSLRSPMFVLLIRSYFTTKTNWVVRAV